MAERGRDEDGDRKQDAEPTAPGSKTSSKPDRDADKKADVKPEQVEEIGGPKGPEPTRFGDWEKGGRCSDF